MQPNQMPTSRAISILKIVFFVSGLSSLVYQVAWQRILTLYYSVENISTTLIVSVYMLGLGIGAIIGGILAEKIVLKIRLYFLIELMIGLFGCISLPFLDYVGNHTAGSNYLTAFAGMFLFLCIPTILMGMTLPVLIKIYDNHLHHFLNSISHLYFINTLGAAVGCLLSSYVLISFFGLDTAIYVAAFLNLTLALTILGLPGKLMDQKNSQTEVTDNVEQNPYNNDSNLRQGLIYSLVFTTGFIAIGYEIVWFRLIGTIVKASPYAFSSILFVFLLGIALGSRFMKRYLGMRPNTSRKNLFFTLQFLSACYVLLSVIIYYYLVKHVSIFSDFNQASFSTMEHPNPHIPRTDSAALFFKDVFTLVDVFFWPFLFIFIPTLFMGASFPLINALAFRGKTAGSTVGRIYFFNVLGNVAGGLITGLLLIGKIGTEWCILLLTFLGLLFILLTNKSRSLGRYKIPAVIAIALVGILAFPKKHQLYNAIHPAIEYTRDETKIISEGLDGVIVTYSAGDKLSTYINGMTHGGRPYMTFYYEAIETLSFNKSPKSVLVIGFGTGSTVETIQKACPDSKITLVELSPTLIENLSGIGYLRSMLDNKNLELIYADGRKYLSNSKKQFDAIFMDPLRTTTSFSNNLYSKEFFRLIKDHLASNGVFMLWTDEYYIVPKTLCSVFPHVNQYSFFCVASNKLLKQDSSFKTNFFASFRESFRNELFKIDSGEKKTMDRNKILLRTSLFPVNEDYKPRCEFYLGKFLYGK